MFAYTFLIIRTQERHTSKKLFFETWKSKQLFYVQRHTGIRTIINSVGYHNTHTIIYGMSNIENLSLVRKLTFYLQLDWFPLFYCLDIFYENLWTNKKRNSRYLLSQNIIFQCQCLYLTFPISFDNKIYKYAKKIKKECHY